MKYNSVRSLKNPTVKNLVRLRNGHHRRRQNRFLIEGKRELSRALQKDVPLEEVFFATEFFREAEDTGIVERASAAGSRITRLSKEAFLKCAYRENPDGLLGVCRMWEKRLHDIPDNPCPLILIIEHIEKPGNLGTLIRTANAAGVDALIVTDPVSDIFNPNVIRASQGSFFDVLAVVTDNPSCLTWLKNRNIAIVASSPGAPASLWSADFSNPTAILLGSELAGLSEFWRENSSLQVSIPMHGIADSLNVAAAAAVLLFEALRQRAQKK